MIDVSQVEGPIRLFLSAGPYTRDGFLSTQQEELDLLKRADWADSFGSRRVAVILCEHVWEHLTVEEGKVAAKMCFDFLEPGGFVRCGVPDALFPSEAYQRFAGSVAASTSLSYAVQPPRRRRDEGLCWRRVRRRSPSERAAEHDLP